jgi:hypothetical protein
MGFMPVMIAVSHVLLKPMIVITMSGYSNVTMALVETPGLGKAEDDI